MLLAGPVGATAAHFDHQVAWYRIVVCSMDRGQAKQAFIAAQTVHATTWCTTALMLVAAFVASVPSPFMHPGAPSGWCDASYRCIRSSCVTLPSHVLSSTCTHQCRMHTAANDNICVGPRGTGWPQQKAPEAAHQQTRRAWKLHACHHSPSKQEPYSPPATDHECALHHAQPPQAE